MAGDNPRDADTDNDGIQDGKEKAGQVVSFTGGVLIVHLFNGDDVKGTVDDNTEIECEDAAPTTTTAPAARAADDGPGGGDDEGDDDHGDPATTTATTTRATTTTTASRPAATPPS